MIFVLAEFRTSLLHKRDTEPNVEGRKKLSTSLRKSSMSELQAKIHSIPPFPHPHSIKVFGSCQTRQEVVLEQSRNPEMNKAALPPAPKKTGFTG